MLFAVTLLFAVVGAVGATISVCMYISTINAVKSIILDAATTSNKDKQTPNTNPRLSSHQKAIKKWRHTDKYEPGE